MSAKGDADTVAAPWFQILERASEFSGVYRIKLRLRQVTLERGVVVKTPSRLIVGNHVVIQRGSIIHCGGRAWSRGRGHITIGNHSVVGPYCILYGAGGITLGEYVHLGPAVKIMSQAGSHSSARLSPHPDFRLAPVHIGRGSWIGAGAVILGGATIGNCVTVAPNSVVTGVVPDFSVVTGNPARVMLTNTPV